MQYSQNVTVTWKIPQDEATHKDWIGIIIIIIICIIALLPGVFQSGSSNYKYVDFMYVGGSQNPLADPVPQGKLQFGAFLPNGKYDYRYL